jgi:hypothetical protein
MTLKLFPKGHSREAIEYAAGGGQAMLVLEHGKKRSIRKAMIIDNDFKRLHATGVRLGCGYRAVKQTAHQHIMLYAGEPMRKALEIVERDRLLERSYSDSEEAGAFPVSHTPSPPYVRNYPQSEMATVV